MVFVYDYCVQVMCKWMCRLFSSRNRNGYSVVLMKGENYQFIGGDVFLVNMCMISSSMWLLSSSVSIVSVCCYIGKKCSCEWKCKVIKIRVVRCNVCLLSSMLLSRLVNRFIRKVMFRFICLFDFSDQYSSISVGQQGLNGCSIVGSGISMVSSVIISVVLNQNNVR